MKLRAILFVVLEVAAMGGVPACGGGAGGKLAVDTPVLPYKAPDIDDITGNDSFDQVDSDSGSAAGSAATAPAPAPAPVPASAPAPKGK